MNINWLYKDKIDKILKFNDENGKYEKEIGEYKIELNSWNLKLNIYKKGVNCIKPIPIELIKTILEINDDTKILFEEDSGVDKE